MCEIVTYQGRNYIRKPASSLFPPPLDMIGECAGNARTPFFCNSFKW